MQYKYKFQYFLMAPQSIALGGPPEAYILPLETTGLTVPHPKTNDLNITDFPGGRLCCSCYFRSPHREPVSCIIYLFILEQ